MINQRGPMGQKRPPLVSKKIRAFARGQPCALMMPWCTGDPATTVHCHIRRPWVLAGIAAKPDDIFGYHGCSECHRREKDAGDDDILRALMITQKRLLDAGLIGELG